MPEKLKRLFRTYVYADGRFAIDVRPQNRDIPLAARRLDRGDYPVIYTSHAPYAPLGAANHVGAQLAGRPAVFLLWLSWTMRRPRAVRMLSTAIAVYRRKRPEHEIVVLCNEEEERTAFEASGVKAILCSTNAFVDEETFRPASGTQKDYDAVHNAAMMPWKRHGLAERVDSCVHIFYAKDHFDLAEAMSYLASLRAQLPHHTFFNKIVDGRIEMIGPAAVNDVLARSRVGLCLSAEEGAMYASVEYLLAGLPVVSTPNIGGRDLFSDPDFWLTADATPDSIREAVDEMIGRDLSPDRIRARTLKRIHDHRERLRSVVADVTGRQVMLPEDLADPVYRTKPVWEKAPDFSARIGLRAPAEDN